MCVPEILARIPPRLVHVALCAGGRANNVYRALYVEMAVSGVGVGLTYPCSRCNKMLKTRQSAGRHGILVHNWDSETDCVPTDEIVTQFKRRKIALTDPLAVPCALTLSEEADSESCSIDTTISKKSTVKHPDMEPDSDSDRETEDEPHITRVDPPPIKKSP